MSENNPKTIRKQLRNICQELLPMILKTELFQVVQKEVNTLVNRRLDAIDNFIKEQLKEVNERSQEMQSYIVRHAALTQTLAANQQTTRTADENTDTAPI